MCSTERWNKNLIWFEAVHNDLTYQFWQYSFRYWKESSFLTWNIRNVATSMWAKCSDSKPPWALKNYQKKGLCSYVNMLSLLFKKKHLVEKGSIESTLIDKVVPFAKESRFHLFILFLITATERKKEELLENDFKLWFLKFQKTYGRLHMQQNWPEK